MNEENVRKILFYINQDGAAFCARNEQWIKKIRAKIKEHRQKEVHRQKAVETPQEADRKKLDMLLTGMNYLVASAEKSGAKMDAGFDAVQGTVKLGVSDVQGTVKKGVSDVQGTVKQVGSELHGRFDNSDANQRAIMQGAQVRVEVAFGLHRFSSV